jgi:Holliday junction resolvase RusA-like endonuclease
MPKPIFQATIPGRPIVKKNTKKVTRRYGRVNVFYSPQFIEWERRALHELLKLSRGSQPIDFPLIAVFNFFLSNRQAEPDTSNLVEGPQDALTKAKIIIDDKIIYGLHATKDFDKKNPRTEIKLYRLDEIEVLK